MITTQYRITACLFPKPTDTQANELLQHFDAALSYGLKERVECIAKALKPIGTLSPIVQREYAKTVSKYLDNLSPKTREASRPTERDLTTNQITIIRSLLTHFPDLSDWIAIDHLNHHRFLETVLPSVWPIGVAAQIPIEWHDVNALTIPIVIYELTGWLGKAFSPGLNRLLIGAIPNHIYKDSENRLAWTLTLRRFGQSDAIATMVLDRFPVFTTESAQTQVMIGLLKNRLGGTFAHHLRHNEIVSRFDHPYPLLLRIIANQDGKLGEVMPFSDAVAAGKRILIQSDTARQSLVDALLANPVPWLDERHLVDPQRIRHLLICLLRDMVDDDTAVDVAQIIQREKLGSHRDYASYYAKNLPIFQSPVAQQGMASALLNELAVHLSPPESLTQFLDDFTDPYAQLTYHVARFRALAQHPTDGSDATAWDQVGQALQTIVSDHANCQSDFAFQIQKKTLFPEFYTDVRIVSRLPAFSDIEAQRWMAQAMLWAFGPSEAIQSELERHKQTLTDPVARFLVGVFNESESTQDPPSVPEAKRQRLSADSKMTALTTEILFSVNHGLINKNPIALHRLVHHLSLPTSPTQQRQLVDLIGQGLFGTETDTLIRVSQLVIQLTDPIAILNMMPNFWQGPMRAIPECRANGLRMAMSMVDAHPFKSQEPRRRPGDIEWPDRPHPPTSQLTTQAYQSSGLYPIIKNWYQTERVRPENLAALVQSLGDPSRGTIPPNALVTSLTEVHATDIQKSGWLAVILQHFDQYLLIKNWPENESTMVYADLLIPHLGLIQSPTAVKHLLSQIKSGKLGGTETTDAAIAQHLPVPTDNDAQRAYAEFFIRMNTRSDRNTSLIRSALQSKLSDFSNPEAMAQIALSINTGGWHASWGPILEAAPAFWEGTPGIILNLAIASEIISSPNLTPEAARNRIRLDTDFDCLRFISIADTQHMCVPNNAFKAFVKAYISLYPVNQNNGKWHFRFAKSIYSRRFGYDTDIMLALIDQLPLTPNWEAKWLLSTILFNGKFLPKFGKFLDNCPVLHRLYHYALQSTPETQLDYYLALQAHQIQTIPGTTISVATALSNWINDHVTVGVGNQSIVEYLVESFDLDLFGDIISEWVPALSVIKTIETPNDFYPILTMLKRLMTSTRTKGLALATLVQYLPKATTASDEAALVTFIHEYFTRDTLPLWVDTWLYKFMDHFPTIHDEKEEGRLADVLTQSFGKDTNAIIIRHMPCFVGERAQAIVARAIMDQRYTNCSPNVATHELRVISQFNTPEALEVVVSAFHENRIVIDPMLTIFYTQHGYFKMHPEIKFRLDPTPQSEIGLGLGKSQFTIPDLLDHLIATQAFAETDLRATLDLIDDGRLVTATVTNGLLVIYNFGIMGGDNIHARIAEFNGWIVSDYCNLYTGCIKNISVFDFVNHTDHYASKIDGIDLSTSHAVFNRLPLCLQTELEQTDSISFKSFVHGGIFLFITTTLLSPLRDTITQSDPKAASQSLLQFNQLISIIGSCIQNGDAEVKIAPSVIESTQIRANLNQLPYLISDDPAAILDVFKDMLTPWLRSHPPDDQFRMAYTLGRLARAGVLGYHITGENQAFDLFYQLCQNIIAELPDEVVIGRSDILRALNQRVCIDTVTLSMRRQNPVLASVFQRQPD